MLFISCAGRRGGQQAGAAGRQGGKAQRERQGGKAQRAHPELPCDSLALRTLRGVLALDTAGSGQPQEVGRDGCHISATRPRQRNSIGRRRTRAEAHPQGVVLDPDRVVLLLVPALLLELHPPRFCTKGQHVKMPQTPMAGHTAADTRHGWAGGGGERACVGAWAGLGAPACMRCRCASLARSCSAAFLFSSSPARCSSRATVAASSCSPPPKHRRQPTRRRLCVCEGGAVHLVLRRQALALVLAGHGRAEQLCAIGTRQGPRG